MLRRSLAWYWKLSIGMASILLIALLYTYLSRTQHQENARDRTIPSLQQLYQEGLVSVITPNEAGKVQIWVDAKATFFRLTCGIVIVVFVSCTLGVLMGCYEVVEAFFFPSFAFLAKIPPTAMLPVFFVTEDKIVPTGLRESLIRFSSDANLPFYLLMIIFGLVPTMAQTVCNAAKHDVPEELLYKAKTLGASEIECIWDVVYKYILPKLLETVRLFIGPAMVYLLAAELLVGDEGLGCRMRILYKKLDMSVVYIYLVCLGVVGLLLDFSLRWLVRRICPWYTPTGV